MGENISEDKTLSASKRRKIPLDRERIIEMAEKVMRDYGSYTGYLEFEYLNEKCNH